MARKSGRSAVFQKEFREDLRYWVKADRNIAVRILDLVEAVMRDPFQGSAKPEPLRYLLEGCWSRRLPRNIGGCKTDCVNDVLWYENRRTSWQSIRS